MEDYFGNFDGYIDKLNAQLDKDSIYWKNHEQKLKSDGVEMSKMIEDFKRKFAQKVLGENLLK